jgi:acyl phosphate:glycerol-3-phosphate acyltransferase
MVLIASVPAITPQVGIAFGIGYLLGSIPFGLVLTKLAGLQDIREIGSGNIGATNVLRTGHKGLAATTLLCDMFKGTFAVILAAQFIGRDAALAAGLGAFLGHLFPVWLRFKGGKGVATYIGILIGFAWMAAAVFGVIWFAVAGLTRYSSLSGLVASAAMPPVLWALGRTDVALLFAILTILVFVKHRANIARLFAGTEPKIGKSGAKS